MGWLLVTIIVLVLLLTLFIFLNVIDLVTLQLRDLLDRVKVCDNVHDLYRLKNELDELAIVFRTKKRASDISRINNIIITKIKNLKR